jgi:hypothetical protein
LNLLGLKPFSFFTLNAALKRRSSTYAFGFCGAEAPLFHLQAFGFCSAEALLHPKAEDRRG